MQGGSGRREEAQGGDSVLAPNSMSSGFSDRSQVNAFSRRICWFLRSCVQVML